VLFADLVGFTPFSESRDSEDVRAMLTRYFERSSAIVERYSGVVDKFIGDAVMAVWGATEAHEDDAERAVRAALDLVDAVAELGSEIGEPGLRLRAGVLSGETSVGPGGNEKGLVVGDLVNTASRLQSIAEPGTVYAGESTYELVRQVVDFEPVGEQQMKGKSSPVPAYRAGRVIAGHGGRRRADTVEPPFVGRDDELRVLKDQFHAVGREGRTRLVSVIGEAGIGKSRLAWELFKYADGLPETTYWHHGRSPAYGDGLTFWALGEMVRRRAGIAETDEPAKSRMKLRTALAEHLTDEDERRWVEPWLAGLLGLDPMPEGERSELFAALRALFHRLAERATTVLVFEDLHWADPGLLDFVTELAERSSRFPILVVTLARPDFLERHPAWGTGLRTGTSIRLAPLPDSAMNELVAGMAPGMPEEAVAAVVGRAAGIPLYAVEFVRMLVATGDVVREGGRFRVTGDLSGFSVPDSLQAVVGARLDRLDTADRALVQAASVLGQAFTLNGLLGLLGGSSDELAVRLRDLVRKELFEMDDDPRSPERGQYHFVQSVVREVAYGRLSRAERYDRHLRVAGYFEDLGDPELAGAIAGHLVAARAAAPDGEAAALVSRALEALRSAIDRAAGLHSHRQVLVLGDQAIGIAESDGARAPFWERMARSAEAVAETDAAVDHARQAFEHYRDRDDETGTLRAARLLGSILAGNWRADEAVGLLEPVQSGLRDLDSPEAVGVAAEMSRALMLSGDSERSVEVAGPALAAAERFELVPEVIDLLTTKGTALGNLHQIVEASVLLRGAAGLAAEHDLPAAEVRALNNLGAVLSDFNPRAAAETWEALREKAERFGDLRWQYQAANVVSANLWSDGRFDEAEAVASAFDGETLPEFWERVMTLRKLMCRLARDPAAEVFSEARAVLAYWDDGTDPQLRSAIDGAKAFVEVLAGEFAAGHRLALGAWDRFPSGSWGPILTATFAAAALRDVELLAAVSERFEAGQGRGPWAAGIGSFIAGIGAALDGDQDRAVAAFGSVFEHWSRVGFAGEIAAARGTFVNLVGPDLPETAEAASALAAFVGETGAVAYARLFSDALPGETRVSGTA
jgi:class 3 adenylate cyclase/predicted NBD/HSP70 family sugar kinase